MDKDQEIVYIGKKAVKRDTVAGTAIIWDGYGDVQEVPHKAAVKMLRHTDVWVTKKQFERMQEQAKVRDMPMKDSTPPKDPAPTPAQNFESKPEPEPAEQDDPEAKTPGDENPLFSVFDQLKEEDISRLGPKIAVVRKLAGREVSVEEVKDAWNSYKASAA